MTRLPQSILCACFAGILWAGCSSTPENPQVEGITPSHAERSFAERVATPDMSLEYAHGGRSFEHKDFEGGRATRESPYGDREFYTGDQSPFGDDVFTTANHEHFQKAEFSTTNLEQEEANLTTRHQVQNLDARPMERDYETSQVREDGQAFDVTTIQPREAHAEGASQDRIDEEYPQPPPLTVEDVRELLNKR